MTTPLIQRSLAILLFISIYAQPLYADDPPQADQKVDKAVEFMMSQVSAYEATIGKENRAMKLHTIPVLRWTNPVSGIKHGILVIWHEQNRPVVVAQVFKIPQPVFWIHECQSLASEPLQLKLDGRAVWAPNRGSADFKELDGQSAPAEKAALRLVQARAIARRFEASEDFRNTPADDATRFVLRLNAQPVYQYESAAFGVTGGYIFAFVNGTDPEVLLIAEAYENKSTKGWRYMLAPMTCWAVSATLDGRDVWSIPEQYGKTKQFDPYFNWVADRKLVQNDSTD